jgi:hypothetical protein
LIEQCSKLVPFSKTSKSGAYPLSRSNVMAVTGTRSSNTECRKLIHYAESRYSDCHCAECRGALRPVSKNFLWL